MQVINIPIEKINPAPYNPRLDLKPGDPLFEKIRRSIEEFDLVDPLVWNKRTGNLVGGHQRLKILKIQGRKEIECSVVDLSLEREKALNLALNKVLGDWDEPKLAGLLTELKALADIDPEFDLNMTGFDEPEISALLDEYNQAPEEEEAIPEPPAEPITKAGEIIELGPHRLMCGDSTKREDVERLMAGKKADCILTDPPYLSGKNIVGDNESPKAHLELHKGFIANLPINSVAIMVSFHSPKTFPVLLDAARNAGWEFRRMLWFYEQGGSGPYCWNGWWMQGECILVFTQENASFPNRVVYTSDTYKHSFGDGTIAEFKPKPGDEAVHPTMKPLWIAEDLIKHISSQNQIIYDPFLGSGSTLIACERLGRICHGMEIDPRYCDVIRERYANYINQAPKPEAKSHKNWADLDKFQ